MERVSSWLRRTSLAALVLGATTLPASASSYSSVPGVSNTAEAQLWRFVREKNTQYHNSGIPTYVHHVHEIKSFDVEVLAIDRNDDGVFDSEDGLWFWYNSLDDNDRLTGGFDYRISGFNGLQNPDTDSFEFVSWVGDCRCILDKTLAWPLASNVVLEKQRLVADQYTGIARAHIGRLIGYLVE